VPWEEFLLDGRHVDDVLTAVDLARGLGAPRSAAAG
jgi:hypothetical protein